MEESSKKCRISIKVRQIHAYIPSIIQLILIFLVLLLRAREVDSTSWRPSLTLNDSEREAIVRRKI